MRASLTIIAGLLLSAQMFADSIENSVGFSFSSKGSELSSQTTYPLSDVIKLSVLGGLDPMNANDAYLTAEGALKTSLGVFSVRSAYVGSSIRESQASLGLQFGMGNSLMTVGVSMIGSQGYPYLRLLYNVGVMRPYVIYTNQVELGLQFIISDGEKVVTRPVNPALTRLPTPQHQAILTVNQGEKFMTKMAVIKAALELDKIGAPKKRTLSELHLSSPFTDQRVTQSPFRIKANAPPGMVVMVNGRKWITDKSGDFRVQIPLQPGTNKIQLNVDGEKREAVLVYLRRYSDLSNKDFFTPLLEKISMLDFWPMSDRFEPTRSVTKGEFIAALIKSGYGTRSDFADMGILSEPLRYDEAVKVIRDRTKVAIQSSNSHQGILTRRVAALLLFELPKVKELVRQYYPDGK